MNNDFTQLRWWKKHKLREAPVILTRKYSADAESALHYKIKRILSWRFR